MRKLIGSLLIVLLFCANLQAQQKAASYSDKELYSIGKCWGFLKYYHPAISRGMANWDSVLLAAVGPDSKPVPLSRLMTGWMAYANGFATDTTARATPGEPHDSVDLRNYNLSWINKDPYLSAPQKAVFFKLAASPNVGGFYSQNSDHIWYYGKREKIYKEVQFNLGYRLLDLFRAWNVIEYFYPYKFILDNNWDAALRKFIPRFKNAATNAAYELVLTEFTATLDDSHTEMKPSAFPRIFGEYGPPFAFLYIDTVAVVTRIVDADACKAANIELGDVVVSADNTPLQKIFAAKKGLTPASNASIKRREVYNYMFNGTTDHVLLKGFKKNNQAFAVSVKRIKRNYLSEWFREGAPDNKLIYRDTTTQQLVYTAIMGDAGYIDFTSLDPTHIDSIMKVMWNTKGLIFDLRGYNDDGRLARIYNKLLSQPAFFGIRDEVDYTAPGKFHFMGYLVQKEVKYLGIKNDNPYKGKVVVLIDQSTQSAEELWAMIFKTIPGVKLIGSQTSGADGNITHLYLTNGIDITFSGVGIYYPDGRATQRVGIVPDIVVKPGVKDIQQGRDVLVERAVELINSGK